MSLFRRLKCSPLILLIPVFMVAISLMIVATGHTARAQGVVAPTCPQGYVLSGSQCVLATPAVPAPSCPAGFEFSQGQCVRASAATKPGPWFFIVNKALAVKSAFELSGAAVCVVPGSPSQAATTGFFQTNRMEFTVVALNTIRAAISSYERGACDAIVVENSLAGSTLGNLKRPADHLILPEQIGGSTAAVPAPPPVRRAAPTPAAPVNLANPLQSELSRMGCLTGRVDGIWGRGSRAALARFSNQAGLRLGSEPSQAALDEARRKDSGYCTPVRVAPKRTTPKGCRSGTVFLEGQCIPKSQVASFCGPGFKRSGSKCVSMAGQETPAVRKKVRCSAVKYGFTRGNTCGCSGGRIFTGTACVKPPEGPIGPGECRFIDGEQVCS